MCPQVIERREQNREHENQRTEPRERRPHRIEGIVRKERRGNHAPIVEKKRHDDGEAGDRAKPCKQERHIKDRIGVLYGIDHRLHGEPDEPRGDEDADLLADRHARHREQIEEDKKEKRKGDAS